MQINIFGMQINIPKSAVLRQPHKIGDCMSEAKASFFDLAMKNIKYMSSSKIIKWHKKTSGRKNYETTASYLISSNTNEDGEKLITSVEIVVNKELIKELGYEDCIPYIIEHEIHEMWMLAKKGYSSIMTDVNTRHLLARRREFLLAGQQGLSDRLFELQMEVNPENEREFQDALAYSKKHLR